MPAKCCVPQCRSNYKGEVYTTVFKFPSETGRADLREKWIKHIPRADWIPTKTSVVCIKHFRKDDVISFDKFTGADGIERITERRYPVLKPDACPTVFLKLPSYLSQPPVRVRKDPGTRVAKLEERHENAAQKWLASDFIGEFKELEDNYLLKLEWQFKRSWHHDCLNSEHILLYTLDVKPNTMPTIGLSIKILKDMSFIVYTKTGHFEAKSFHWLCSKGILERWSQIENLLSYCLSKDIEEDITFDDYLTKAHDNIVLAIKSLSISSNPDSPTLDKTLRFLDEQLRLMATHDRAKRYSSKTQCFAFMTYIKSPACYRFIRKSQFLCLPHPSNLKRLIPAMTKSTDFNTGLGNYLQIKSNSLSSREKVVAIQMDEIYVKAALHYTGGKLIGTASNAKESATTVQAFMISSMFSNYTEVVGLIPMKNMTTRDLQTNLLKTIQHVQSAGFFVLSVIADNNAVNRKVYNELTCVSGEYSFDNPQHQGKPIFLLHDSVHLLKCIWSNWINLKDADQTFIYPLFPVSSDGTVMKATLSSLKTLYSQGRHNIAKLAPSLTYKALFPSNIEKQKVSLALGVFNSYNVASLQLLGQNETANFISVILQWWNIVNVKDKFSGTRTRNAFAQPITDVDRSNLRYLLQFGQWLEAWKNLNGRLGKLSTETFNALTRTVNAVVKVSEYAFSTLDIEYILLGKLQTDNLEARFGEYRQLSGSNYLVSVQQVLEAEKKLKLYSVLCMYSSISGEVPISDMSTIFTPEFDTDQEDTNRSRKTEFQHAWFLLNLDDHYITVPERTVDVLIYVSGFLAFRVSKRLKCSTCSKVLQQDKLLTVDIEPDLSIVSWLDYTRLMDRGGLKYPSQPLAVLTLIAYLVVQTFVSEEYEQQFLAASNHKEIVMDTVAANFLQHFQDSSICTDCGCSTREVLLRANPTLANIFLNNYRKVRNDTENVGQDKISKKRKLRKFNKQ